MIEPPARVRKVTYRRCLRREDEKLVILEPITIPYLDHAPGRLPGVEVEQEEQHPLVETLGEMRSDIRKKKGAEKCSYSS